MKLNPIPRMAVVMTAFPWFVDVHDPVSKARDMMRQHKIHHLPVMENSNLESIISERDINRVCPPGGSPDFDNMEVGDLAPVRVYVADFHDPLDRVLEAMMDTGIGSVLVTRDGELVGIFTEDDASRLLLAALREENPDDPENIRA